MKIRLFSIFFLLTGVILADAFGPPDMDRDIFDAKKVSINQIAKGSLFSSLLSVARDFDQKDDAVDLELRSHSLAIAGRLDPDSDNFKNVLEDLRQRGRTVKKDATKGEVAGEILRGVEKLMRQKKNADNLKCAAYCIDIGLRIDPNGKHMNDLEELQRVAGKANWKDMIIVMKRIETIPGGNAQKIASIQSAVIGLSVQKLPNGRHAGGASGLRAIAHPKNGVEGIEFHIDKNVGPMTENSLEQITKLMRIRHEERGRMPKGYQISITFDDKDRRLDGFSAGTAMAIILDSLFSGLPIDENFAVAGGITASGKVTPVGGVAGKVRAAIDKNCQLVGIPAGNSGGVSDLLVLVGIENLLAIQIFSLETLDDALKLAATDRPNDVQATIDEFNQLSDDIKENGIASLKTAPVINLLERVLQTMPNHESAKILLSVAKGNEPKTLSIGGSFHELECIVIQIQGMGIKQLGKNDFDNAKEFVIEMNGLMNKIEDARELVIEINGLMNKIDPRFKNYGEGVLKLVKSFANGPQAGEQGIAFADRLQNELGNVFAEREKLMQGH